MATLFPRKILNRFAPLGRFEGVALLFSGQFKPFMEGVGNAIDAFGVTVTVLGTLCATFFFLTRLFKPSAYREYRQNLARAILLGLEILIAGDIIRTVAVAPTLENAAILGLIIIIRTFLSTTLQLEVEGRWPWQREPSAPPPKGPV